jgi:predicted regulator of Ras-like GTPase activity (Roadblock/LC7/MglB family)
MVFGEVFFKFREVNFIVIEVSKLEFRKDIEDTLAGLTSLLGVNAVLISDRDGNQTYSWYRTDLDKRDVRVTGEELLRVREVSQGFGINSNIGGMTNIIVRGPKGVAILSPVGDSFILYVSADRRANLALLLVRIRRAVDQLLKILGGGPFGGVGVGP